MVRSPSLSKLGPIDDADRTRTFGSSSGPLILNGIATRLPAIRSLTPGKFLTTVSTVFNQAVEKGCFQRALQHRNQLIDLTPAADLP